MDPRLVGRQPRQAATSNPDEQQMQSAKFSLLSSLLKPEPKATKLTPNIINEFHPLLLSVAGNSSANSPEFISCVARIVTYIAPSRRRTLAMGDHLHKLASSFRQDPGLDAQEQAPVSSQQASVALKFLHLLATAFACINNAAKSTSSERVNPAALFASGICGPAVKLVELAALRYGLAAAPAHKQIHALLSKWTKARVFTKAVRIKLRDASRTAYDAWLTWLKTNHRRDYDTLVSLSTDTHSHSQAPIATADDSWYNVPISAVVPHIKGQQAIKTSALESALPPSLPLDPELGALIAQHIDEVANVFAGANVARFSPDENVSLNGLGQPISVDASSGKRKRIGPVYYGVTEKCSRSFKKAREELPVLTQLPDSVSTSAFPSRNVPPPMDVETRGFSASYPNPPSSSSPARGGLNGSYSGPHDGGSSGSNGNGWRGGPQGFGGDRGRGYSGRGGGANSGSSGRGRGRGG